ncbi:hypothetical protein [Sphingobium fuliginis]|uniref:hypothetical protein n=1 Tax=Sphingobium fuliginis (strain ATCC 27551) TaxID=336203 RepID=UPI00101F60A9|nr:hypothetical protein [Sphingobium fuliginis]RYL99704.1 hypothetical protein EWH10_07570 [Sphingobium fuliginis]
MTDRTPNPNWMGPACKPDAAVAFGMRLAGGGAHQSKTMMFDELDLLLGTGLQSATELAHAVIEDNVLGKSTKNSRGLTYRHMVSLYGLNAQPALSKVLMRLWTEDLAGRRLNCLLVALARDPLLRDSAPVVLETPKGTQLYRQQVETAFNAAHPDRMSEKMVRSLAQNCNASWTQSGHLEGRAKKIRRRVSPTPSNAALAALIASACGFGGPSILSSIWLQVLDLTPDQALDQLRRAEGLGLAKIRAAGDVTEILVRQAMATTLGVPELEHI